MSRLIRYFLCIAVLTLSALIGVEGRGSVGYGVSKIESHMAVQSEQSVIVNDGNDLFSDLIFRRNISSSSAFSRNITPHVCGFTAFLSAENPFTDVKLSYDTEQKTLLIKEPTHYYVVALHRLRI